MSVPRALITMMLCVSLLSIALPAQAVPYKLDPTFATVQDPGNIFTIHTEFTNNHNDKMKLKYLGILFNWTTDIYAACNPCFETSAIIIEPGQMKVQIITVTVPNEVEFGAHEFYWNIKYDLKDNSTGLWQSFNDDTPKRVDFWIMAPDDDRDGYANNIDVFPNNRKEWFDTDKDGVGDNSDAYPNDARRWEQGDILAIGSAALSLALLFCLIVIIVVVIGLVVMRLRKKKKAIGTPLAAPALGAQYPAGQYQGQHGQTTNIQAYPQNSGNISTVPVSDPQGWYQCSACGASFQGTVCTNCGQRYG